MNPKLLKAYRNYYHSPVEHWGGFVLLILFSLIGIAVLYAPYFKMMQDVAYQLLTWNLEPYEITYSMVKKPFLGKMIPFIIGEGEVHSFNTLFFILVGLLLFSLSALCVKVSYPLKIAALFTLSFISLSVLFFLIMPESFPYSVVDFEEFYLYCQFYTVLMTSLLFSFIVIYLPGSLWSKGFYLTGLVLYLGLFGIVRYALFLYFLMQGHLFLMPLFIFFFGPIADYYLTIVWYSLYSSRGWEEAA